MQNNILSNNLCTIFTHFTKNIFKLDWMIDVKEELPERSYSTDGCSKILIKSKL